jgi:hypothetical protein
MHDRAAVHATGHDVALADDDEQTRRDQTLVVTAWFVSLAVFVVLLGLTWLDASSLVEPWPKALL